MKKKVETFGEVMAIDDKGDIANLPITSYLQANYKDNRVISILGLMDGSYGLSIENPASTGRATKQYMGLTEESATGLLTTMILYFKAAGFDEMELVKNAVGGDAVDYRFGGSILKEPFKKGKQRNVKRK